MSITEILYLSATILTCAAAFGWANLMWFRLPHAIAMLLYALVLSAVAIGLDHVTGGSVTEVLRAHIERISFDKTLMIGMLSFLLFAGALHVDLAVLLSRKWPVFLMATLGVFISTFIVGYAAFYALGFMGMPIALPWCLVFGALISPTDPVAVMSMLKKVKLPEVLETAIAGESLFNDGMGVVVFTLMLYLAVPGSEATGWSASAGLFLREVVGGLFLGFIAGWFVTCAMRKIDDYNIEVLITLALVTGLYSLCLSLHMSGPLAVVVAGLVMGNHGTKIAMSDKTRKYMQMFWSLIDEILKSVLFLLIGFQVLVFDFSMGMMAAIAVIVPVVLVARFISVAASIKLLPRRHYLGRGAIPILTWAGLRGGISVALALSLPSFPGRETILIMTYGIVVFSIILQGMTVQTLARRYEEK